MWDSYAVLSWGIIWFYRVNFQQKCIILTEGRVTNFEWVQNFNFLFHSIVNLDLSISSRTGHGCNISFHQWNSANNGVKSMTLADRNSPIPPNQNPVVGFFFKFNITSYVVFKVYMVKRLLQQFHCFFRNLMINFHDVFDVTMSKSINR